MNRMILSLAIVASLGASLVLAEESMNKGSTTPSTTKVSTRELGIIHKLDNLTPEQKTQIDAIKTDASERVRKIHEEAMTKIEALLTPEQKAQLSKLEAEQKEHAKEYREKKKAEKGAEKSTGSDKPQ